MLEEMRFKNQLTNMDLMTLKLYLRKMNIVRTYEPNCIIIIDN